MAKLRFVVGLLSLTLVTLFGSLVLAAAVFPWVTSMERVVVTSGSMSPSVRAGDVVLLAPQVKHPINPGNVVMFTDPQRPGELILHRVVGALPQDEYRTQGDANPTPDTTAVTHEMVRGQARVLVPLVGRPAMWLQNGEPLKAVVTVGLAIWVVRLSRYGLMARYVPWRSGSTGAADRPPRGHGLAWYGGMGLFLVAVGTVAAEFPAGAFSASVQNAGNYLHRADATSLFLRTNSTGDTTSSAVLPLDTTAPTLTTLHNYDTNRDSAPGLLLAKSGVGLEETDSVMIQKWELTTTEPLTLSGTARLRLWSAMTGFDVTKNGSVSVGLYDCDGNGQNCSSIAASTVSTTTGWSGGSADWVAKDWDLGVITRSVDAGRTLQVRLVVDSASEGDMIFAYDTTTYPTELTVG